MIEPDPSRLSELDGLVGEVFQRCEHDSVELDVEVALARHRSLVASGALSPLAANTPTAASTPIAVKAGLLALLGAGVVALALISTSSPSGRAVQPRAQLTAAGVEAPEGTPSLSPVDPPPSIVEQQPEPELLSGAEPERATEASKPESPALAPVEEAPKPATATAKATRPTEANEPEPRAPVDSLRAELALIVKARRALKGLDHQVALNTARSSLEQYPTGTFVEEALAIEILALVGLGQRDSAEARAKRFRDQHPHSALHRRVEDALAEP